MMSTIGYLLFYFAQGIIYDHFIYFNLNCRLDIFYLVINITESSNLYCINGV